MTNTEIRIWIHTFFSTKDIMPLIRPEFEKELYIKIKFKIEEEYKSYLKCINGTENHVHILMMLNPVYNFSDILKNLKGETSHWINENRFIEAKFAWQKSYAAHSVSESRLNLTEEFISNQKIFHSKFTFLEELKMFRKNLSAKTV